MSARAIFLDDERRAKRASFLHFAFWCAFLIGMVALLCAFCLHIGDSMGYHRATEEWAHKVTVRPAPRPDVFKSFGTRGCIEYGRAAYQQCRQSAIRKEG